MKSELNQCDSDAIDRFLAGEIDPDAQSQLESHLDVCQSCCQQISSRAADEVQWNDVKSLSWMDWGEPSVAVKPKLDFLSPTDDPRMLGRFAGYEIAGLIGQGGMGLVLKAFDPALNRYSAIKVLSPHYASSGAARKRFAREAQAAAAVVHDNVIAIHGVGESNGMPYLVMPYVRGESLQKRLDREGALPIEDVLRIAFQSATGLAAAHEQGLVHRDIKPANILLSDGSARVLITDFGLARAADDASLTRSGVIAGTPQYMSPEQARGEDIDERSDLFSLGSVIYTMSTGRIPFRADTPLGTLRRITDHAPRSMTEINSQIPPWLIKLSKKLLAKAPSDRYATATEVANLLRSCLTHLQTPSTPLPTELVPGGKRIGLRSGIAVGLFICCIAIALFSASLFQPSANSITKPVRQTEIASSTPEPFVDTPWDEWDGLDPAVILKRSEALESEIKRDW